MAAVSYESALQMAQSLSDQERLRLIQELTINRPHPAKQSEATSILDICGLGADVWAQIDAQEYIHGERSTWDG